MKHQGVIVAVILLLAGCTTPEGEAPSSDGTDDVVIDQYRPTESFGHVETGPAVGPDLEATTAAPPRLVEGEWWSIRFADYLGEGDIEVVRVVADVNEDGYIFGMPHEGWLKEAIAFHSPAFGDVTQELAYDTHNVLFEPVRFPLEAGVTWETAFATAPYVATVAEADEHTATIVLEPSSEPDLLDPVYAAAGLGAGGPITMTYDARQHEIVRMESDIGMWEVVEHGYGFEGWVTVPRGEHTAIDYGTFGPPLDQPAPVGREVQVEGGFNRLTMMHLVGSVGEVPAHIEIRDVDPAGTEFVTELQGSGFVIEFYESNVPDGTWFTEETIAGAGFSYHMGIAYHQYDIHLPDGARRSDHNHDVIR